MLLLRLAGDEGSHCIVGVMEFVEESQLATLISSALGPLARTEELPRLFDRGPLAVCFVPRWVRGALLVDPVKPEAHVQIVSLPLASHLLLRPRDDAFAQSLAAPWVDARAGRIDTDAPAPVSTGEVDAKTWAQRTGEVISHYDFGVRATNAAKYHVKADPPKKRAVAEEDVALLKKELDKLQAAGLGLDAAANAFADVVNAGLIPLVDAAVV